MQKIIEKGHNRLPGVKCVVNSCYYHGQGDCCMASAIEIQPPNAGGSQDTDCATFMPR